MTEEEIKMQLEVKNKEIYQNKLKLDLINNNEGLVLTIDNLLNKMINESVNYILGIIESFQDKELIEENIKIFFDKYQKELMNLLDNKKKNIEELIKNDTLDYQDKINIENDKLNNKLYIYYQENIEELIKKIQYKDEFINRRINNYLTISLKDKLIDKIKEIIKNRDIILINTFKETYKKYLELNKNTVG